MCLPQTTHSTDNICNPVVKLVNSFCKIRFANHHHHLHITSHIYTTCLIQSVLPTTFFVQPWHHMGILLEIDMGKKREDSSCFTVFVSTTLGAALKKLHIIMRQSCCNTKQLYASSQNKSQHTSLLLTPSWLSGMEQYQPGCSGEAKTNHKRTGTHK